MGDALSFSRSTSIKYVMKLLQKLKKKNLHVAWNPLGTIEILRVK